VTAIAAIVSPETLAQRPISFASSLRLCVFAREVSRSTLVPNTPRAKTQRKAAMLLDREIDFLIGSGLCQAVDDHKAELVLAR
jgi:hypothetical protein